MTKTPSVATLSSLVSKRFLMLPRFTTRASSNVDTTITHALEHGHRRAHNGHRIGGMERSNRAKSTAVTYALMLRLAAGTPDGLRPRIRSPRSRARALPRAGRASTPRLVGSLIIVEEAYGLLWRGASASCPGCCFTMDWSTQTEHYSGHHTHISPLTMSTLSS